MIPRAARHTYPGGLHRVRTYGSAVLLGLALIVALQPAATERLRTAWFDMQQVLAPRKVHTLVTVVEIDQKSIAALGQWPWPRNQTARLVEAINAAGATAIGLDILMPEADALSPERAFGPAMAGDPALSATLRSLPTNDELLGRALSKSPSVLAFAGTLESSASELRSAPVAVRQQRAGYDSPPAIKQHAGALISLDALNRQSAGWGLISADPTRGVVRRMPLVASINGTLVPAFGVEMLRVASRAPLIQVTADGSAAASVQVGTLVVPVEADGGVRPYFSPRNAERLVSAVDVLSGRADTTALRGQLVIIGPTALALHDEQNTPLGIRMPGSEIHAQLIENLIDGTVLERPSWGPGAEAALLLALGALLVWALPQTRPLPGTLLAAATLALPFATSIALFRSQRVLIDGVTPSLALVVMVGTLLLLTLAESTRQRRALERTVQAQREQAARIAGELAAAQRIQTGSLPKLDLLRGDARITLHATLTPAREVGGDLYDFFMLDRDRLFVLIGDVAGKGLSASIFMAVSKALYKGSMLRAPSSDIGDIMSAANAEVSRDNAEMLFVTAFAAILDLSSGELSYCNAGHDNPFRLLAGRTELLCIEDGDGPPLCAMDDFAYTSARCQLEPGETLCLMTDGVNEAQNGAGALYGNERVLAVLRTQQAADAAPRALVEALQADVTAFAAGAEPADDLTLLVLRWNGPA